MKNDTRRFIKICRMTQTALKKYLVSWLQTIGYKPVVADGYVYAKGSLPVCVTAHLDTVHKETAKVIAIEDNENKISSPQGIGGDDRCGVFMIQRIVEAGYKPTILFCEDEEVGGGGSDKFCVSEHMKDLKKMKFLVELDRAHDRDLVFYHDDNSEFHKFCAETTGYKRDYGTFSDISNLCPECKVSGVNISCGYYNAHQLTEYVLMDEMLASIEAAKKLLDKANDCKQFEYKERKYNSYYWDDDDLYGSYYGHSAYYSYRKPKQAKTRYYILARSKDNHYRDDLVDAVSEMEAIGIFLSENSDLTYGDIFDYYEYDYMFDNGVKYGMQ